MSMKAHSEFRDPRAPAEGGASVAKGAALMP